MAVEPATKKRGRGQPAKSIAELKAAGTYRPGRHGPKKKPVSAFVSTTTVVRPIRNITKLCREGIPGYDPWRTEFDCKFYPVLAKRKIRWYETNITHVKGAKAREPFVLEDWQRAIVGNLFGWLRPDGTRRYREALIYVPRKEGKTPLAAGIVNLMLFDDNEPGAEMYLAAAEYQQASLTFAHAVGMVYQNEELSARAQCCNSFSNRSIVLGPETGSSSIKVIGKGAPSKHGFNTHGVVIDELHTQPDSDLVDTLRTSTGARRNPLIVYLTTADYERPGSVCNEIHDHAIKVRDGIVDDYKFLPVIYQAEKDDDWTDEAVWRKANPNLGVSISLDYLRELFQQARETPRLEWAFKRLHLNMRTEQDEGWFSMAEWRACGGDVDPDELAGRSCWAGLDLSATRDITALVLAFPIDGKVKLLPFFWVPAEAARERQRRDRVPYMEWIAQDLLWTTPGNMTDYSFVRRDLNDLAKTYRIEELAVDVMFQGAQLASELGSDGFRVTAHGQGFRSMAAPTIEFERLMLAGLLRHGDDPVLDWMASNVAVERDAAGNMKPSKATSTEKIDGIVSAIMAVGRMAAAAGESGKSAYETRGIDFF